MGFYPDNRIILDVKVDANRMLGKIAKIKKLEEELSGEISTLQNMLSIDEKSSDRKEQTVFDLLTAVTDTGKFAEIIYDLLEGCENPEEIKLFLDQKRDNLDEAIDYLKSRGYPMERGCIKSCVYE